MFIDIHAHAYLHPVPFGCRFCTPEELLKLYDEQEIECGILLPVVNPEIYLPQSNEEILDICQRYPTRFFPFCNIDPRAMSNSADAPLYKIVEYYKERGCKGIGEIMPNMSMMDPKVQNLFKHAEACCMPVTCDGSDYPDGDFGLYEPTGLPYTEQTLRRFPNLRFIGHGPIFWHEIERLHTPAQRKPPFKPDGYQAYPWPPKYFSGPIKEPGVVPLLLREYDNLYGELSETFYIFERDEDFAVQFITEFQDKLLFGTDCCGPDQHSRVIPLLKRWRKEGRISEIVFQKIARENAIRLFNLPM